MWDFIVSSPGELRLPPNLATPGGVRALEMPVLYYMPGQRSTESAREVARLLLSALQKVTVLESEQLGHVGPVTHPDRVNEAIGSFLGRA